MSSERLGLFPITRMPATAETRTVLIVENPRAGRPGGVELVDAVEEQLANRGFAVERASDPNVIHRRLTDSGPDSLGSANQQPGCIVCAGGDGTISMVANWASPATPLAVLPLGTENLLAKQLGFDQNIDRLCDAIASGHTRTLDAGEAMAGCSWLSPRSALTPRSSGSSPLAAPATFGTAVGCDRSCTPSAVITIQKSG